MANVAYYLVFMNISKPYIDISKGSGKGERRGEAGGKGSEEEEDTRPGAARKRGEGV